MQSKSSQKVVKNGVFSNWKEGVKKSTLYYEKIKNQIMNIYHDPVPNCTKAFYF